MACGDAEVYSQFVPRIRLVEGRGETFVEVRLDTLDGTDDGNMWSPLKGQVLRNS